MRVVFFGSGAFGLPVFLQLVREREVALVVSQPDRPAGRNRTNRPTEIAQCATDQGLRVIKPEEVNDSEVIREIRQIDADAYVVIAFGQKLGPDLLGETFAINLHASLLPKFRGAAPINWAVIDNESHTGVSVITLAQRMDAGEVLGSALTAIDPGETAGELHDRLAAMGPDVVLEVLERHEAGTLVGVAQDESKATKAPKLSKAQGSVDFNQLAMRVRARIHGLTPWPGCMVRIEDRELKLLRVRDHDVVEGTGKPGEVLANLRVACGEGCVELLSVQPPGGKAMSFAAYANGHDVKPGTRFRAR